MKHKLISTAVWIVCSLAAHASSIDLNGIWDFRFEDRKNLEEAGQPGFLANEVMLVPGCFDVMQPHLNKRGTALYRKEITFDEDFLNAWWKVQGMGLRSRYWVDGKEIGYCAMPYASFEMETGPLPKGKHVFEAAVDNMFDAEKMKLFLPYYDFYAFGGFYHGMSLTLQKQKSEISRILVRTKDYKSGKVEMELLFHGNAPEDKYNALISFDDSGNWEKVTFHGRKATLNVPNFKCWSPETPHMHEVKIRPAGSQGANHMVSASFGIRTIETANGKILLNGKEIFLKGANRHESHPTFGSATPPHIMLSDLKLLKSIGGNFIRGAHYQQAEEFLDLCDKMGILVWEESLGWGNTAEQMKDPDFVELQVKQTTEMVIEDMNHPSVIIFAFMNENASETNEGKALGDRLIQAIRDQDSGRLVSFACNRGAGDRVNEHTDLISFNTYPGWIGTNAGDEAELREKIISCIDNTVKSFQSKFPGKPILISEMGTCGIYGAHDPAAAQWTEEFQAEYVGDVLDGALAQKDVCGIAIWQFIDCPSYHRGGSTIRTKPFAQNLAGLYDAFRRPKMVVEVVRERYLGK